MSKTFIWQTARHWKTNLNRKYVSNLRHWSGYQLHCVIPEKTIIYTSIILTVLSIPLTSLWLLTVTFPSPCLVPLAFPTTVPLSPMAPPDLEMNWSVYRISRITTWISMAKYKWRWIRFSLVRSFLNRKIDSRIRIFNSDKQFYIKVLITFSIIWMLS